LNVFGRFRSLGPGLLVAAAFIGPGTVTTATVAGARFGYALLWALAFSVVATIVLQEMSARLGLVTREGLGEALRATVTHPVARILVILLVVSAIALGNVAYQMGNITGAAIGLEALSSVSRSVWALVVGASAFAILALGNYRWLERILMVMVGVMSVVFLTTAIVVRPSLSGVFWGAAVPTIPPGSLLTIIALIGTTVVPYNLFLHASVVREKWPQEAAVDRALQGSRLDTLISISLGGLVTLAVVVTAAAFFERGSQIDSAAKMAEQLQPLLGPAAHYFFATGLLAAGLTSAVTAPLAAAYATAGALNWPRGLKTRRFRAVWATIVIAGTVSALVGREPVAVIVFAQAANGILLPIIAVFLLIVMNRSDLLGRYKNGIAANLLGGVVVLVASGLGVFQLLRAFGVLP
jgi:manganese transport protein